MREMRLLVYSTFAFMLYFFMSANFIDLLIPIPETKTVTVNKIDEFIYYFTPYDHTITGKFYNNDGYFLVVYNEKSEDFEIQKVEEEVWENEQIDRHYYD